MEHDKQYDLFAGLRALAESAFPKYCKNCGRNFESSEQFLRDTQDIRAGQSGLKQSWDDNEIPIVELFRNCPCGSTLMDYFSDRRDLSQANLQRREKFAKLIEQLVAHGWSRDMARTELLKILHGEKSEQIELLKKGAG